MARGLNTAGTGLYVVSNESQEATAVDVLNRVLHRRLTVRYARCMRMF